MIQTMRMGTCRRWCAIFALAAVAIASVASAVTANLPAKSAVSTDVSDIWWNSGEPGWGMQLVQTGTFAFATLYIYSVDGSPTFVTAELELGPGLKFSGPVYVSSGAYFGGPYGSTSFQYRQAGTMTFTLTGADTGSLAYSIDGVAVSKLVERQPLTLDDYSGQYILVLDGTASGCFDPLDNGYSAGAMAMQIAQQGLTMHLEMLDPVSNVECSAHGRYSQAGRDGRFSGQLSCEGMAVGTIALSEMRIDVARVNGRLSMSSTQTGCALEGHFAGLVPYQ